jgi:uncharacterized membrane protein
MITDFKNVRFWDLSLDGAFIDRIYTGNDVTGKQIRDDLIAKGFNPDIEISEAY